MKNVLITTDFSPHAKHTIEYVVDLLKDTQTNCRILLLNTYLPPLTSTTDVIKTNDEMKIRSKMRLEEEKKLATLCSRDNAKIKVEVSSRIGSLKNVISQLLEREKFDFVAMGKDGGKNVEKVAEILKKEECPLFITYGKK